MAKDWKRQDTVRCVCPHCEKSVVETHRNKSAVVSFAAYFGICSKCKRQVEVRVSPAPEEEYEGLSKGNE